MYFALSNSTATVDTESEVKPFKTYSNFFSVNSSALISSRSIMQAAAAGKKAREMIDDEVLISAVQAWTCLWDRDDERRSVPALKKAAWESVSKEVGVEVSECRTRWMRLRDYFVRITRQRRKADKQGLPYQKKVWYLYEPLMFLYPMCAKNDDRSGLITKNFGDDEMLEDEGEEVLCAGGEVSPSQSFGSDDFNNTSSAPIPAYLKSAVSYKKRKRKAMDEFPVPHVSLDEEDAVVDDPNELFFRSLLPAVSKLDDIQIMEFRMDVQSLVLKHLRAARQREELQQEMASTSGLVSSDCHQEKQQQQDAALDLKTMTESGDHL